MNSIPVSCGGGSQAESKLHGDETGKPAVPLRSMDYVCLYAAFLLVGCGSGWLLCNGIYAGFGANYASVQDSNFFGATTLIQGFLSIGLALLYPGACGKFRHLCLLVTLACCLSWSLWKKPCHGQGTLGRTGWAVHAELLYREGGRGGFTRLTDHLPDSILHFIVACPHRAGMVAYLLFTALRPDGLSKRGAQLGVGALCFLTVCGQAVLAWAWDVRDAEGNYPALLLVFAFGLVVATMTSFVAYPLVTVHYGGRLIAPFRAGTDLSQMLCALLSEAQAPRGAGGPLLFPSWVLQVLYAALAAAGLASWMGVVGSAAGLRRPEAQQPEPRGPPSKAEAAPGGRRGRLRGFACPASLAWPVLLGGVVTQVNLWALTVPVGNSSARMTDPESCGGDQAAVLYKVPLASLLSSLARCPRPLFYGLFALQCACVAAVWLSLLGVGREALWQTAPGRTVWCAAFALIGGLEGYLLTMTYRYVGDDPGLAAHLRDGACRLMSWGGVMATNLLSLAIGICILRGGLACVEPDT
ncbi:unnamed protein product [Prorocentrum cordatum]|uniref:Solute carrier family 40 protein n=1 Tax=Prorocentrum cordatum TaxID=2364126 RepID=A0ABN9VC59_9DINO|nr:unnamed protein product [Polarella glacialis]